MNDDVKKALEELEQTFATVHRVATHQTDEAYMSIPADPKRDADLRHMVAVETLRTHIDGEPARLAAAREEQREVDYGATLAAGRAFIDMMMPSEPFGAADFSRFESCAKFTRSPLTATPLADRIAKLEATLRLERDLFRETFFTPADKRAEKAEGERDAAQERVKELECERVADLARVKGARWAESERDAALTQRDAALARVKELEDYPKRLAMVLGWMNTPAVDVLERDVKARDYRIESLVARVKELEAQLGGMTEQWKAELAERDTALARAKELEADVEVGKETCRRHGTTRATAADGWPASKLIGFLSHSLAGKDAAIKDAAESASQLRSERDALKTQLAEAAEVLRDMCEQVRAGRGLIDTLRARIFLAKYPEGR